MSQRGYGKEGKSKRQVGTKEVHKRAWKAFASALNSREWRKWSGVTRKE